MKLRLKNSPFKIRLFTGIGMILTALALIVSFLFSYSSLQNAIKSEQLSSQGILEQIGTQVETLYLQMDTAALSIIKNPGLRDIVLTLNSAEGQDTDDYLEQRKQNTTIQTTLGNVLFSPVISNAILYNRDHRYFYYAGTYLSNTAYIQEKLAQRDVSALMDGKSVIYNGPHPNPWLDSEADVISVVRNFSNSRAENGTVVEILAPRQLLDAICSPKSFREDKEILILNDENRLIYPGSQTSALLTDCQYGQILEDLSDGITDNYHYAYSWQAGGTPTTGFTVLLISNNRGIRRQAASYTVYTLIVVLITLLTTMAVMFGALSMFTKPLKQLIASVGQLRYDSDTKIQLPEDTLDEFEILSATLDQMVRSLKESIKKNYELQIRESNASLAALQSQVDPHFLYNAMNSISAASELYGSGTTTAMCQMFSSIMRYVTSPGKSVTLIEELKHTEHYMEFMKISNDGNFTYSIHVDPALYPLSVPKLSIQPFIENSFKHGFKSTMPPWEISIVGAVTKEGRWRIEISDNGCGFEDSVIREISQKPLAFNGLEVNGLGLNNTFSRFHIYFQGTFTYHIQNLDNGCRITLEGDIQHDKTDCS